MEFHSRAFGLLPRPASQKGADAHVN
jgi:hypothetical protein